MGVVLSDLAKNLLDGNTFVVLCTTNPDFSPQSSVIWAKRDGDEVLFSTILGRRKTRNMERDPRVSLCAYDPDNPYRYFEIRGTVTMTTEGGVELIDELSQKYVGQPFGHAGPGDVRVVCRVTPVKVFDR